MKETGSHLWFVCFDVETPYSCHGNRIDSKKIGIVRYVTTKIDSIRSIEEKIQECLNKGDYVTNLRDVQYKGKHL